MSVRDRWNAWARRLKVDVRGVYLASRDPRVPWYAKALALVVAAYAFTPIDLIPDFIPVLGYLDDLVLVPLGIALVIRLIPDDIWSECKAEAAGGGPERDPRLAMAAALAVVLLWVAAGISVWGWAGRR